MSTCQERVISSPQEDGGMDSMAPCGVFQICDSDSESHDVSTHTLKDQTFLVYYSLH